MLAGATLCLGQPLEVRGNLSERYAPSADISGSPVLGVLALRAGGGAGNSIVAQIPASWAGQVVCARMVSSDGRYDGNRPFGVPLDWRGGLAQLDIPTQFGPQLDALDEMELGVSVSMEDCAAAPGEQHMVPAAWGSTALGAEILVLVNSFRADEAYLYISSQGADIACEPARIEARTAFDMICPLPPKLVEAGGQLDVELNRIRRGTMMGSDYFTIDLP